MFPFIHHDTEYEVEVFCPNCGSKNVVVNYSTGFFDFSECLKCGSKKGQNRAEKNRIEQ